MISNILQNSKKVVIKIGSSTIANDDGTVNHSFLKNFAEGISFLKDQGIMPLVVSSGAMVAGVSLIDKWQRKNDLHYKQALAAIGQVELMRCYSEQFAAYGIYVAQLLLTKEDFFDEKRSLNTRNTLFTLTDEDVLPIVNENDTVSTDQIKIGDNDTLSARVANLWNASCLIILSDIDGIFNKNPKDFKDAKLIREIKDIDRDLANIQIGSANSFGTGGVPTKIEAARMVNRYGIPMILANGGKPDILKELYQGQIEATVFQPKEN